MRHPGPGPRTRKVPKGEGARIRWWFAVARTSQRATPAAQRREHAHGGRRWLDLRIDGGAAHHQRGDGRTGQGGASWLGAESFHSVRRASRARVFRSDSGLVHGVPSRPRESVVLPPLRVPRSDTRPISARPPRRRRVASPPLRPLRHSLSLSRRRSSKPSARARSCTRR